MNNVQAKCAPPTTTSRDPLAFSTITSYVTASGLPSLSCGAQPETYRLHWKPAFRASYLVSISRKPDGWTAVGIEFIDPRGKAQQVDPSTVVERRTRRLTTQEVNGARNRLADINLWTAAESATAPFVDDGWHMWIEGRHGNTYRMIERGNVEDVLLARFAERWIDLAGLPVPQPISQLANGYGTPRVDPWAALPQKTAWIMLGLIDRENGRWMTQKQFSMLRADSNEMPRQGDVLLITAANPLYVVGWARTGAQRQMESPGDQQQLSDDDEIGTALFPGAYVVIDAIDVDDHTDDPARGVWARVSPRP